MPFDQLPELVALDCGGDGIRIPPDSTVPVTARLRALLDAASLRRLSRISQLGLVATVYPGATHSRFEHSLGVYRLALEFLSRLRHEPRFAETIDEPDAAAFIIAALLHDVGHWAFCHPLEDMGLAELPRHESLVHALLVEGELATLIENDWGIAPARVASLIAGTAGDQAGRVLCSLLSGPIDVDKMDYLARDSLHAGVPYGRHFDQERLLSSLCLDESGETLAITEKGRTAAELMVFARYVMFSEVYWHHAVRAATAMLQRSVWLVRESIEPARLMRFDDREFIEWLVRAARGSGAAPLVDGLFGPSRRLVKRAGSFDALHHPQIHRALAGRSYAESVAISRRLAERLSRRLGKAMAADTLLIDAPPAEREVEFRLAIRERTGTRSPPERHRWRSLAELSPVVRSLAHEQFDNLVKRVRLFAPAESAAAIAACDGLDELILEAAG